jgi:pimeloyl-ACP methyl ester carboxylesterase
MATAELNGVRLEYEITGAGEVPLVLVHGSWVSRHSWDLVTPRLARSFRVLTYDRRGHSGSTHTLGQGSIRDDVADLAGLIERVALGPAWVAGNSFGGSIALRLAGARADLVRGVIAHEPPLFSLLAGDPVLAAMLEELGKRVRAVVERIAAGDHTGAAEQFVETALGPGAWGELPADLQRTFVQNAPTFLDEARDPEQFAFDLAWLEPVPRPALLTKGDESPPTFAPVVAKLAGAVPQATVLTFPGAGHIPHRTHPEAYTEAIDAFIRKSAT